MAAVEGEAPRQSNAANGVTVSLDDGRKLCAPLLVAAEGRNSPTREAAGIRVARWKYDHAAIVSTLRHERPHDDVAYEIFYPAGPFALLPMTDDAGGHRSAIVWSVGEGRRAGLLSLSDADFAAEAEVGDGRIPRQDHACSRRARPIRSASTMPRGSPTSAWRWSAMPRTPSTRSPGRASISASAMPPRWPRCWSKARGWGSTSAIDQLLDRYQRWRSLDTLMVAAGDRQPDPHLRRPRQDRLGGAALRHGPDRPHRAGQEPADGRSARHERRLAAAAPGTADLTSPPPPRGRGSRGGHVEFPA